MKRFSMKTIILALVSLLICATLCITVSADYQKITSTASGLTLENENVIFSFDDEGVVTEYTYKGDGESYLGSRSYFAILYDSVGEYLPSKLTVTKIKNDDVFLTVKFETLDAELDFKITVYDEFFVFEMLEEIPEGYTQVELTPVRLASKYVSADFESSFATFSYALHYNTIMTTYPSRYSSHTSLGVNTYSYTDSNGLGARYAVIGCEEEYYYDVLRFIAEFVADRDVLPLTDMGGAYAMTEEVKEIAVQDYAILASNPSDSTIRHYLDYNVTQFDFHQGANSFLQGSMDFAASIGDTAAGFKTTVTDRIKKIAREEYGKEALMGLHTYAYYIATSNTALLSLPETVRQLEYFEDEVYTLSSALNVYQTTIPVYEDTSNYDNEISFFKCNSKYIRIDDELMYVNGFGDNNFIVSRGQCGTKAAVHRKGSDVYHLTGLFGMLCPQMDSQLFKDIAKYTARAYVDGGFGMIYIDALDGLNRHTTHVTYQSGLFLTEIMKEINRLRALDEYKDLDIPDPIFEYSSMSTSIWNTRTRTGAMDTVCRGYKDFVAYHTKNNYNSTVTMNYTTNIGWYALINADSNGPRLVHNEYWDTVDLLGKNIIAYNMGYSYNGFSEASVANYPLHKANGDLLVKYLRLRDEGYFTTEVIEKIKDYRDEWKLIEKDGEYGFEHRSYSELKFNQLSDIRVASNPFDAQVPKLIRLQGLNTDAETEYVTLIDLDETAEISNYIGANGKTAYKLNIDPEISIATYPVLRVRVYGNGSGAKLSIALDAYDGSDATYSYVIPLDFEGWREVILSECENGITDNEFYSSGSYAFNRTTDTSIIEVTLKGSGDFTGVYFDTIKLGKKVFSTVTNPGVSYFGNTVVFNTTLTNNDFIEFDGTSAIQYTFGGVPTEITYTTTGDLKAGNGDFNVALLGTGANNTDRLWATFGFAGEQVFNDLSNEAVSELVIKTVPDKTSYIVGETLDTTGLSVYELMNTGRKRDVESGWSVDEITFTEAGILKIPVTYDGFTTTFTVVVHDITPVSLSIKTLPDKTNFYVGQEIDTTGLVLFETYNNGDVVEVTSGYTLSHTKFTEEGYTDVTVTYGDLSATYEVYVATPSLMSIAVTKAPTKTVYTEGELFSTAGMVVTGTYSAGLTAEITDYTYSPATALTLGTTEVVIEKNGITAVCPVTVLEKTDETDYTVTVSEGFALPGGSVTLTVSLGSASITELEGLELVLEYDEALTLGTVACPKLPAGWEIWQTATGNKVNIALIDESAEPDPADLDELTLAVTFTVPADATSGAEYTVKVNSTSATDTSYSLVEGDCVAGSIVADNKIMLVSGSKYVIDRENGYVYISHAETSIDEFYSNFATNVTVNTSLALVPTGATVSLELDGVVVEKFTVILPGDVNGDGKITTTDYTMAKRGFLGTALAAARKTGADVNRNGYIDTNDYILIKKHYTGDINIYK
ncbi:MAG: bacterial Ig-like domain-containing protein [Clostridia bacterium]|nr:bacterial Ig-like domain-containing protein [Clostridia bacterium]